MGVTNLYPNLPGHLVEFKDGGLQLTTNPDLASGKSLLILGTALDGPINEPVQIDATTVSQLFGSEVNENGYPNGATLTKYAKQAFKNGFTDVRCMRVTGSQALVDITKKVPTSTEVVDAKSVVGEIEGNKEITISLDADKRPIIPGTLSIKKSDGVEISTMANALTENATEVVIPANKIAKNETLSISYYHKAIDETETKGEITIVDGSETVELFDVTKVDGTDLAKEGIYVNEEFIANGNDAGFPATKGLIVIAVDENGEAVAEIAALEKGVDYTVTENVLAFNSTEKIQNVIDLGAKIAYSFFKYTVSGPAGKGGIINEEPKQVITLDSVPVAGSVIVKVNGAVADASAYTVDTANKTVTLEDGKFAIEDDFEILYKHEVAITADEIMTVRAVYGGEAYNNAKIAIEAITFENGKEGRKITFTKPKAKKYSASDEPFFFTTDNCPTVGTLRQALSNYALNNVFEIITDNEDADLATFPTGEYVLAGGDNGIAVTNNQMFEALSGKRYTQADVDNGDCTADMIGFLKEQGAYQILENYNVDFIYPAGVYADSKQTVNPNSNFHYELALLCAVLTYRTKMTHGFIDVKPNSNTTLVGIQKHVDKLLSYNNIHYMRDDKGNDIVDANGDKMDLGWYTSVVVGPEPVMVSDALGTYYGSPAIAYAALNGIIKAESAPTNKALPGVKGMKYKFSNKQMNELVGNRMVVFKLKNEGTATASSIPYVVDGCTAGAPGSDYARLATVKVVTDVVDQIREVSDPFLGEPNTIEQRNALAALISKRLSFLLQQGEILHYEFEINATVQQVVLGECSISLTLVAPQELRKITTVVALRAAA